jgi:hypothetical protein
MIVRREAFAAVGGFRTGFGKIGAQSRPEDTDLCIRMQAAGGTWLFQPAAVVGHHVPQDRSSYEFFVRRCYHEGRGKAELARLLPNPGSALSEETDYVRRVLPRGLARHLRQAARTRRPEHLARAASILVGLAATVAGYAWQKAVDLVRGAPHASMQTAAVDQDPAAKVAAS